MNLNNQAKRMALTRTFRHALQELVNDVTTLCMRVLRLQGAHVEQLMNADYDM